jgi:soluble cytochrome b562
MTISGVSSCSSNDPAMQQMDSRFSKIRQAFDNLGNALQSGNLSDAQSAFGALSQLRADGSQGTSGAQGANSNNPVANDMAAVGQALQSGDLAAARSAFAKVQQDARSAHHGHHHHRRREESIGNATAIEAGPSTGTGTDAGTSNGGTTRGPRVDQMA